MSYGDHWSEPARCSRCGQERGTHDDGACTAAQMRFRAFISVHSENKVSEEHVHNLVTPDGGWICLDIMRLNGSVQSVQWYNAKDFTGDSASFIDAEKTS